MILRIWAFLTGRRLVWLRDFDGEVTLSIAKVGPRGELTAPRYPFLSSIRTCVLGENGKVVGGGYVTDWKFADQK